MNGAMKYPPEVCFFLSPIPDDAMQKELKVFLIDFKAVSVILIGSKERKTSGC
jgi:hypothetical protein